MKAARVDKYTFGKITIGGEAYTSDVLVLKGRVKSGWRREDGHSLGLGDLKAVRKCRPELLVVGTGASGEMFVLGETEIGLEEEGIELVFAPTGEACGIFNDCLARGKNVAGAFHLTC